MEMLLGTQKRWEDGAGAPPPSLLQPIPLHSTVCYSIPQASVRACT